MELGLYACYLSNRVHPIFFSFPFRECFYTRMIVAPKGIRASLAILKHCRPKGIPMMVIQSTRPIPAAVSAISNPPKMSHSMFTKKLKTPLLNRISRPKGHRLKEANLKHCMPTGIPKMVMHQSRPAKVHSRANTSPHSRNQITLPMKCILNVSFSFRDGVRLPFGVWSPASFYAANLQGEPAPVSLCADLDYNWARALRNCTANKIAVVVTAKMSAMGSARNTAVV